MKVLVFGKTGQVATELQRQAPVLASIIALGRADADLENPEACARVIADAQADVIINAAAFTDVDGAESQADLAETINGKAPAAMAQAAQSRGIPFLHVSTDYVFDGSGDKPWQPNDITGPIGSYGRSKLLGDVGVAAVGGAFAILRTSWVFSSHGNNFVKTMLRLGREREALQIVDDQIGGPTAAADIAATLLKMAAAFHAGNAVSGLYHYAGAPDVSWKDFAIEIFRQAGLDVAVTGIPSAEYPTAAARPLNSRLDCASLYSQFGIGQPDWRVGLKQVLAELD
jgi:dTDP-4-dehydrorhamnose reductase